MAPIEINCNLREIAFYRISLGSCVEIFCLLKKFAWTKLVIFYHQVWPQNDLKPCFFKKKIFNVELLRRSLAKNHSEEIKINQSHE